MYYLYPNDTITNLVSYPVRHENFTFIIVVIIIIYSFS